MSGEDFCPTVDTDSDTEIAALACPSTGDDSKEDVVQEAQPTYAVGTKIFAQYFNGIWYEADVISVSGYLQLEEESLSNFRQL